MALDDLLASARTKLPLLRQVEGTGSNLSAFTTQRQEAPQVPIPQPVTPLPVSPSLTSLPVPSSQVNPLQGLQDQTQSQLAGLSLAPGPQVEDSIPLMQAALGPILGKGQGGTGSAQGDIDRGVNIVAHGISSGTTSIPSGGPTSDINYADLPGKYGPLVDPPGGPSDLRLQKGAWQSLHRLGVPAGAILGGSYRTYAQQAASYAKDPNRFAPPGKSLHEYGLAIDVNSAKATEGSDIEDTAYKSNLAA